MSFVTYEPRGCAALLTLNRPEALNALNTRLLDDLDAALSQIGEETRCVVLTGSGAKAFAAGADIAEMAELNPEEGWAFGKKGNDLFLRIEHFPVPVIAAVNGWALGGGCELSLACDIRLCSENAVFAQPETGLGITPGFGGTQRLSRTVGMALAKEMIFSGRRVKAEEALRIGLVNRVCPPAELLPAALALAEAIGANAPIAVRHAKEAMNEGASLPIGEAAAVEEKLFGACFGTEDQREGMRAFLEKRKPGGFQNR